MTVILPDPPAPSHRCGLPEAGTYPYKTIWGCPKCPKWFIWKPCHLSAQFGNWDQVRWFNIRTRQRIADHLTRNHWWAVSNGGIGAKKYHWWSKLH